jgi:translation initiation factor 3 subunit M
MPAPKTTLLIEGSFEELTDELAQYLDNLKKSLGDENSNVQAEVAQLLQESKKDDVLKKLVIGGQALNQAPEKGMRGIDTAKGPKADDIHRVYSSV